MLSKIRANIPGLMPSVAGYSAYFADLSKEVQDEVILRIERGLL